MSCEIILKPLEETNIPLFESWIDKEYIKKWFGDKEYWFKEINERSGMYSFLKHFIVYHNNRRIGYCLYGDCFYIKDLEEEGHDFKSLYGDVAEENHTYEIGFLIGKQEYLNKGIGKMPLFKCWKRKLLKSEVKRLHRIPMKKILSR